jgi:cardiolipin synthase
MVRDIQSARTRVWMESYIFVDDAAGRAIAAALKERARAGVDVRLVYDAFGSWSTPRAFFDELREASVQVHGYHTLWEALGQSALFRVFNQRNHRKLLVVDDRVGYFGGMNIIDLRGVNTVSDAKAHQLAPSAGWRDVHARLVGPQQEEIAASMEHLWCRIHRLPSSRRSPWPLRKMLGSQEESLFFFANRPGWRRRSHALVFAKLIQRARRNITLSMAYFLPVGRVLRALYRARRRGVKVRIIVPAESDVPVIQWATRHLYDRLLRRGIRVYERKHRMLHSKVMVVDDRSVVLGSCNLDPRSFWLNLEFSGVLHSPSLAAAVKRICAFEMRQSRKVTAKECKQRSVGQRLLDRAAYSLRRWL